MLLFSFLFVRSNKESYSRGAVSAAAYEKGKKRSLVSLKMCILSWLIELISSLFAISFGMLHNLGFHNLHYPDCIIVNIVIPMVHLINDEDTKGVILERGWYQGLRHMIGTQWNTGMKVRHAG